MLKHLTLFFICCILMSSFVYSVPPTTTIFNSDTGLRLAVPLIQYLPQGVNRTFHVHVFNISNGVPITNGIECFLHIYHPNGSHIVEINTTTVFHNFDYEFPVGGKTLNSTGVYQSIYQCHNYSVSLGGEYKDAFEVTATGTEIIPSSNILIGNNENILIFFAILISLILLLFGITKEDSSIVSLSAIIFMVTGVFILISGFSGLNNLLTLTVGTVLICVGGYIFIRANMDYFMELF